MRRVAVYIAVFSVLFLSLIASTMSATPSGGGAKGAGGSGGSPGGSNPASGPAAPQTPIPAGFKTFYVVAAGPDANFQTYVTELTARWLAATLVAQRTPRIWVVAEPAWTQDTIAANCAVDANMTGAVLINFVSFYTDAYWVVFNNETEHVTPSVIYIACYEKKPIVVTPTINLFTQKSQAEWTVPLAPIAGISALFGPKGGNSAFQTSSGVVALAAVAGSFNGNVGVLNPGHEALSAANVVSVNIATLTAEVCHLSVINAKALWPDRRELGAAINQSYSFLALPEDPNQKRVYPGMDDLYGLLGEEDAAFAPTKTPGSQLDPGAWASASPSPSPTAPPTGKVQVWNPPGRTGPRIGIDPMSSGATSSSASDQLSSSAAATNAPSPGPLRKMCSQLGEQTLERRGYPAPTPSPTSTPD